MVVSKARFEPKPLDSEHRLLTTIQTLLTLLWPLVLLKVASATADKFLGKQRLAQAWPVCPLPGCKFYLLIHKISKKIFKHPAMRDKKYRSKKV